MSTMLEVRDVTRSFDGFVAVSHVSLDVIAHEKHAIIGPNGAGKTTFFNLVSGSLEPDSGDVTFMGRSLIGTAPHKMVDLGLARSFQRVNIFPRKTVFENVQVAFIARDKWHFRLGRSSQGLYRDEVDELLEMVGLTGDVDARAGELAHGKQKQLELAVTLAAGPKLLMLDEPTAGMSISETRESIALIDRIASEKNLTLLFTEHDMTVVFGIADRVSVMHHGEIIASGDVETVRADPEVKRVYLGHD